MPSERRAVLRVGAPSSVMVVGHAGEMQQHGKAGRALDQRADGRALEAKNEIALPVSRHRAIRHLGGALADHDLGRGKVLAGPTGPRPGNAQGSSGAQTGGELPPQCAAPLDVERLVDGLRTNAHRAVVGEIHRGGAARSAWDSTLDAQRRCCRRPRFRPVHATAGPRTRRPAGVAGSHRTADPPHSAAAAHSWPALPASGDARPDRRATGPSSPCTRNCRISWPALRRSSREIVDGARLSCRPHSRTP